MRRTGVLIWILWMGLFGFTSCTDRLEEVEEQYTGENEVWVRLIVSRPYSGKEVRSKAGNDRETEIDEIQLWFSKRGDINTGFRAFRSQIQERPLRSVPVCLQQIKPWTFILLLMLQQQYWRMNLRSVIPKTRYGQNYSWGPPRWKFHYFTDVRTLPAGFRAGCELPARNQRCEHVKSCCPGRCVGRWDYEF